MTKMHDFLLPPYGVQAYFTTDRGAFEKLTTFNTNGCAGMCCSWLDDAGGFHVVVGVFSRSLSDLVHECSHAALAVAENAGFDAHCGDGEPFSYLMGYLFTQCQERLKCHSVPSSGRLH